jgi:hypothetical protein
MMHSCMKSNNNLMNTRAGCALIFLVQSRTAQAKYGTLLLYYCCSLDQGFKLGCADSNKHRTLALVVHLAAL